VIESVLEGRRQPDQRSCGAASLVAAQMLVDPGYAETVSGPVPGSDFAREALAMHRRVTGLVDARGVLQLPWPRVIGTPPWAVARQMSALSGPGRPAVDYDTRLALGDRELLVVRMSEACAAGRPVPVYVGDRWLPRHVVLAIAADPDGLRVYDPARGMVTLMRTSDFVASTLPFGRWRKPWFVVVPDTS
jgi:hypothetical protein